MISVPDVDPVGAFGRLAGFRAEFHRCLSARNDALFELADAVLCGDTAVRSLAELSLAGQHRRGHGAMYAALNRGRIDVDRLRTALSTVPRSSGWQIEVKARTRLPMKSLAGYSVSGVMPSVM